jgi:hypothetical protein
LAKGAVAEIHWRLAQFYGNNLKVTVKQLTSGIIPESQTR